MKKLANERGFIHLVLLLLLVVVIVGALGYAYFSHQISKTTTKSSSSKALSHPGVVSSESFAASIDSMGTAVNPSAKFTTTTPNIYVVVGLSNATSQRVEYTRYLSGKFVDNGSIPLTSGAKYASFKFALKTGQSRHVGSYLVKVYTNGVYERSASFVVQ